RLSAVSATLITEIHSVESGAARQVVRSTGSRGLSGDTTLTRFRSDAIQRTGLARSAESVVRNTQHSSGWERLPSSKRWNRLRAFNLAVVVISALLIIALSRLQQPYQIFLAFFYPLVCANIMGALITTTLVRFGRRMYFQPFPLNWLLIAGAILACTLAG